jgi:hypothetical protein
MHENPALDPAAMHHNPNGTTDVGLAQVNTVNFNWTGLTMQTAMEPCQNLRAGMMVFFAKYNGNPPDEIKRAYAEGAMKRIAEVDASEQPQSPLPAAPNPFTTPARSTGELVFTTKRNSP